MLEQNELLKGLLKLDRQEETQSEPVKIETDGVFNQDYLDQVDPFENDPLKLYAGLVGDLKSMASHFMRPPLSLGLPPSEHKVRIFRLNNQADLTQIESAIEEYLNDGWCCHHPTICNDFILMDFSRRKESEEDATVTR